MSKIADYLEKHPLAIRKGMTEAGINSRDIETALKGGEITKVAPGLYIGEAGMSEPDLEYAIASASTGGVIGMHTAAGIHGLIDKDGTERHTEIFVRREITARNSNDQLLPLKLIRTADERLLTLGVETRDILGIPVMITSKARTVVDLLRSSVRQHAVTALGTYVTEGNDLIELHRMAEEFGVAREISDMVDAAQHVMRRPGF